MSHASQYATAGLPGTDDMGSESEPIDNESVRPPRLLVVDDDAAIREMTSAMLAEQGYEVWTAEDGVYALDLLSRQRPDLMITDLIMPRMLGFELLKIVRERFPRLPCIAVSGEFSGDEIPPSVLADAFVPKGGCYIEPLKTKITQLLLAVAISNISSTRAANRNDGGAP
jgi:CheY-like chemotaxis protein